MLVFMSVTQLSLTGIKLAAFCCFVSLWWWFSPFSCVLLLVTPWTVAHQAPLSMGFSREEYWSGLPFPSPGDLSDPGIKPASLAFHALQEGSVSSEPDVFAFI